MSVVNYGLILIECIVSMFLEKYPADQYSIYAKTFQSMSKEVTYLQKLRSNLGATYQDYSLFRRRNKRGLIVVVGDAASFLFGLTTHKELDAFRKNVINLSKSQSS